MFQPAKSLDDVLAYQSEGRNREIAIGRREADRDAVMRRAQNEVAELKKIAAKS